MEKHTKASAKRNTNGSSKNNVTTLTKRSNTMKNRTKPKTKTATSNSSFWLYTQFWCNNKAKKTDRQLQKLAIAKFPKNIALRKLGNISRMRRRLNLGRIKSFGMPKIAIKIWDANGKGHVHGTWRNSKNGGKKVTNAKAKTHKAKKSGVQGGTKKQS